MSTVLMLLSQLSSPVLSTMPMTEAQFCASLMIQKDISNRLSPAQIDKMFVLKRMDVDRRRRVLAYTKTTALAESDFRPSRKAEMQRTWDQEFCRRDPFSRMAELGWRYQEVVVTSDARTISITARCVAPAK